MSEHPGSDCLSPHIDSHRYLALDAGWRCAVLPADAASDPVEWRESELTFLPASVPGTVAAVMRAAGRDVFASGVQLDAQDYAYRCSFAAPEREPDTRVELRFDGLATLCEVWLNGKKLLQTEHMFVPHVLDVTDLLLAQNELLLRFRALDSWLAQRRPRPRFRTKLVDHQQLRWLRTSLLGRMPGWSPPLHAVGPYRPIALVVKRSFEVTACRISSSVAGDTGKVALSLQVRSYGASPTRVTRAEAWVGDAHASLACTAADGGTRIEGDVRVPDVQLWWPHTHGAQPLYGARVQLTVDGQLHQIDLGHVGFRTLSLDHERGAFALTVNGVPVFCRGACWTTLDVATLGGTTQAYEDELAAVRAAGMNMLRISGTMFYENDAFYRTCDALGILVWQDFMFANMDYPADDPAFRAAVEAEASAFLERTQACPSLAVLCGGSEVEQQIAMLGLPRTDWQGPLFYEVLPAQVARLRSDVPYWPASPGGGALPFIANEGVTHYYGVGAYLRPLEDARRAEVKFAAECLAFANVPHDETLALLGSDPRAVVHHPKWKERVPRDVGASWDFEDVRDHYLRVLFGVEPLQLRYTDLPRYLELSRVVSGEVMASTFHEWRRDRSSCAGALVWFYRDLWPGAGWGVVDATGRPKAAYYYLKRALAATALFFSDEGLNGLHAHVINEGALPLRAELRVSFHRDADRSVVASEATQIELAPHAQRELSVNALLPWFLDTTYAYRFGPPAHDLVVATLTDRDDGRWLCDAFHFTLGLSDSRSADLGLTAGAQAQSDGAVVLTLRTERCARAVAIDCPGYFAEQNYLHLPPASQRQVRLQPQSPASPAFAGQVHALNGRDPVKVVLSSE